MVETAIGYAIQFGVYGLELALFAYLLGSGKWRHLRGAWLYVGLFLALDAVGRPYVLYWYGFQSDEYAYFFWLSDVAFVLAAYAVLCAFFRRASQGRALIWHQLRFLLVAVFVLTLGYSALSLHKNYDSLFTIFIVEFQQNLYFTCLVLTTLLYIFLQKAETEDEQLVLLVSGLGIQYAGPAANFALVYLTQGQRYASIMATYVLPLCTLGMLLIWLYAVTRPPMTVPAGAREARAPALAAAGRDH
jgi:hypothetical protein